MNPRGLEETYMHLRSQLDAAYAAPVWDSHRIDRITEQMDPIEAALAAAGAAGPVDPEQGDA